MGNFDEAADFQQQYENRTACDLVAVENALVKLIAAETNLTVNEDIFAGLLPPSIANGIGIEISSDWPGADLRLRNYYAKCEGRDSDHNRLRRRMSQLAARLPLRRRVSSDFLFTIVSMDSILRFDDETYAGVKMAKAAFDIEFHIEINQ